MLSVAFVLVGYCALIGLFGWLGVAAVAAHLAVMLAVAAALKGAP